MADAFLNRLQAGLGGTYVLEDELVGGGMSRVFVGREATLGRVVVKVLPGERATRDPIERFKREAELGARLEHPNIVPVYDVGEVDDILYFTMPFIDGETLRHRLNRAGLLLAAETRRVLEEIGSALVYAHGRGVVHRDVKPENVFLDLRSGRAMLADFGVAMAIGGGAGGGGRGSGRPNVTQPGTTVGTPAYMSPEQVDGIDVDGRSDVYSLGLVGWGMLTGTRPWTDPYDSVYNVMHKQKHQLLPSMADLRINAPPALVDAIEKALLKDRRFRWATAAAFVTALRAAAKDDESSLRTQKIAPRDQRGVEGERGGTGGSGEEPKEEQDVFELQTTGSRGGGGGPAPDEEDRMSMDREPEKRELPPPRLELVETTEESDERAAETPATPVPRDWRADPLDADDEVSRGETRVETPPAALPRDWRADPMDRYDELPLEENAVETSPRRSRRADPLDWDDELAAVFGRSRRTKAPLRSRRVPIIAAVVVLVLGASILGAITIGPGSLMQRFMIGSVDGGSLVSTAKGTDTAAAASPSSVAAIGSPTQSDPRVDTVASGDVAAGLAKAQAAKTAASRPAAAAVAAPAKHVAPAPIEPKKAVALKPAPPKALAATKVVPTPAPTPKHVAAKTLQAPRTSPPVADEARPVSREKPSSRDLVRARIATALVSLREYERVQAELAKVHGAGAAAAAAGSAAPAATPNAGAAGTKPTP